MSATNNHFARIPFTMFDAMEKGEITLCMLLVMIWLYRWADWSTGVVRKTSADRLVWATHGAFHKRTFQQALDNLAVA